jgi:hypothetical protein
MNNMYMLQLSLKTMFKNTIFTSFKTILFRIRPAQKLRIQPDPDPQQRRKDQGHIHSRIRIKISVGSTTLT